MTTLNLVLEAISEQLGQSDYAIEESLLSYGADSLDFLEILMILEDRLEIILNEEDFSLSMSIRKFAETLNEHL